LRGDRALVPVIEKLESEVLDGMLTPSIAADRLIEAFESNKPRE
jgi:hypothetical protein